MKNGRKSWPDSKFFPIIAPLDDSLAENEDKMPDEALEEPKQFDAPVCGSLRTEPAEHLPC
jgi:hypothetical protein